MRTRDDLTTEEENSIKMGLLHEHFGNVCDKFADEKFLLKLTVGLLLCKLTLDLILIFLDKKK